MKATETPAFSGVRIGLASVMTLAAVLLGTERTQAAEAAQGMFDVTLDETFSCTEVGGGGTFVSHHTYDDKTFVIPMPPGNNTLTVDFADLGPLTLTGSIDCVFDQGGTFNAQGITDSGDFQWIDMSGEYIDRVPGVSEGDPFPFVGTARCTTTRNDDFQTLCDNFEFSFNGLGRALPPAPWYKYYDGDFTFRAVRRVPVGVGSSVDVQASVDGPGGAVPEVQVTFKNGVQAPGDLSVATLADAHGIVPPGFDLGVRGATTIDHGSGPVAFFEGGDERFVEVSTDASLPGSPAIEVCLPIPGDGSGAAARPVRILHGEGTGVADRQFIDRTSRVDPVTKQVCASVKSFSKFAVVSSDVCGGGQSHWDGLLTVAGGLLGRRTVVVDSLTDCALYPTNLPKGLAKKCVPDADPTPGQCGVSLTLGVNRASCNRSGLNSSYVATHTYAGTVSHGTYSQDLTPVFGPLIGALSSPVEATLTPPVVVSVPVDRRVTTYTLRQELTGWRPPPTYLVTDRDVVKVKCVDPSQF